MIELMNTALLEVNARRRVEVIARDVHDARRHDFEGTGRAAARRAQAGSVAAPRGGRAAGCRSPLTEA
jgi:hypothetical protein